MKFLQFFKGISVLYLFFYLFRDIQNELHTQNAFFVIFLIIIFIFFIFTVILTISFVAFCVFTLTACLPAKSSSHSWPCQRDKDVRPLLSDALKYSRGLARTVLVLSNIMVSYTMVLLSCQFCL